MELFVLMAQRNESYAGEYGLEALGCATEYDCESNPDYLPELEQTNRASGEFSALSLVCFTVDEKQIRALLFPEQTPLQATITTPKI